MSNLLEFMDKAANAKDTKTYDEGFTANANFLPWFWLSEENKDYIFSVIDIGTQTTSHWKKFPAKDALCVKKYYGEECEDCKQETGRTNERKRKVKQADGTEKEETYQVAQLNKPTRNLNSFIYLHNHTGGSRPGKNDPDKLFPTPVEMLSKFQCGELNTNSNLEKDRNIKNILEVHNMGCLGSTVFKMSRKKVKDDKGKEKDQTSWPTALPSGNGKAKIKYEVPGTGMVENLVDKLVVPTDIQEKYDNMTIGEKVGIILDKYDSESVLGSPATFDKDGNVVKPDTTHRKGFWLDKGVVFPTPKEVKPTEEKSMDDE